jgi:hypothetical protein
MSSEGENTAVELLGLNELLRGLDLAKSLADLDLLGLEEGFLFDDFLVCLIVVLVSVVALGCGFFLGFLVCCLLDSAAAACAS